MVVVLEPLSHIVGGPSANEGKAAVVVVDEMIVVMIVVEVDTAVDASTAVEAQRPPKKAELQADEFVWVLGEESAATFAAAAIVVVGWVVAVVVVPIVADLVGMPT